MKNKNDFLLLILLFMVLLIAPFAVDLQVNAAVIDPVSGMVIASGVGAGLNAVGGTINNIVNRSNMRKSADIAKELMDYQWNNFQSPRAQSKSMRAAGLNPAVAFGQGGTGHFSSPSVNMPTLPPANLGLSGTDIANVALAASQAKKAGNEAVGQALNNKVLDATLEDQIQKIGFEKQWSEEQVFQLKQKFGLISATYNEMQANIDKLKSEKALNDKSEQWYDRHMQAEINDLIASKEYKEATANLTNEQKELLSRSMEDLVNINHFNAEQLSKVVGLLDKYGDAQAIVGMISQVVGSASGLLDSLMKVPKLKDFLSNKDK